MNGARMPGQPCEKKEGGEKGPKKKKRQEKEKKIRTYSFFTLHKN